MEKIVIHKPGGFDRLKIESFPDPEPKENELMVETKAIGVNYADIVVRMGYYASAKKFVGWPITPGFEFSGRVSKIGKDTTKFSVGDRVLGLTRFDAYASHVVVPQHQLFKIPDHVSFEEVGCFPVTFLTAYYALNMVVKIYPKSIILVHSAAGGVGSAALQLCNLEDWQTIGVVGSSHKVKDTKNLGADFVIDKSSENLWKTVEKYAPEGVDVVLDGNGMITLKDGYNHLRETGKLISYGFHSMFPKTKGMPNPFKLVYRYLRTPKFSPIALHNSNRTIVTLNLSFLFHRTDLLEEAMTVLNNNLFEGKIRMPKITTYPFAEVAQAHKDLQSAQTIGKLVLVR